MIAPSIVIVRLLWRCFFAVFAVVVGTVVLAAVPQAREALLAFAADAGLNWPSAFFIVAVLYWAAAAWFTARLLLGRQFERDNLGASPDDPFVDWFATVLPRALAIVATLPLCVMTLQAHWGLGLSTTAASMLFIVFLVLRRRFGDVDSHTHKTYAEFQVLGASGRQACLGLLALSFALLGGFWSRALGMAMAGLWAIAVLLLAGWERTRTVRAPAALAMGERVVPMLSLAAALLVLAGMWQAGDEIALARSIGSPAILLCALASWTLFGGLVLSYLPMTRRWPSLAPWLPPLLVLAGSLYETHWVAQRDLAPPTPGKAAAQADWRDQRLPVTARFDQWMAQHRAGEPVYLVAVVGGASRAGFWAGTVLSRLEDEARAQHRRFAANVFALSSISGGSLGAAAWVADLAQHPDTPPCAGERPTDWRRTRVERFLGGDFLSPVVARMLFPDLATRFVPIPVHRAWSDRADRSLGLEQSWIQDWPALADGCGNPVDWSHPLTELYARAEADQPPWLPSLLINTVRLDDGQRFLQSNVRVELPGVMDLFDKAFDTERLTLAQAVHNSARFPYVSPLGALRAAAVPSPKPDEPLPRVIAGRLGDGGYHEGSGAATLADLIELLLERGQLRARSEVDGLWACVGGWPTPGADCTTGLAPVVALIIDSEAARYPEHHVRDPDGRTLPLREGQAAAGMPLPELLGPVFGGLSTRTELSRASQQRLSRLVGGDPRALVELRMPVWRTTIDDAFLDQTARDQAICVGHGDQPSMNWALDRCSRARLRAAAAPGLSFGTHPTLAQRALVNHLARLRRLIGDGAVDFGVRKGL